MYPRALDQILALALFLSEDADAGLAAHGLTRSRAQVVWRLHHDGPTTQRALADAIGVSARNITTLVDALVRTGFVTREPHPTDRRAALVTLTARGAKTADALARDHRELSQALFAHMPPERFECLVEGLSDVIATLQRLRAAARASGAGAAARP